MDSYEQTESEHQFKLGNLWSLKKRTKCIRWGEHPKIETESKGLLSRLSSMLKVAKLASWVWSIFL